MKAKSLLVEKLIHQSAFTLVTKDNNNDYFIYKNHRDLSPDNVIQDFPPLCGVYFKNSRFDGVIMEDLLAICIDRLKSFQEGPFACDENQNAINHLEQAKAALDARTTRLNTEEEFNV